MAASSHPIVRFYDGNIRAPFDPNDPNTTLNDVLLWDDDTLEHRHDYIQYLFPLPEPSGVNPDAPLITKEVRDAFIADPGLRSRLLEALHRMKQFYYLEDIPESPADSLDDNSDLSGTPYDPKSPFVRIIRAKIAKHHDHNHLRLTRIIRCLRVLGCADDARELHSELKAIDKAFERPISQSTIDFWKASMEWPLYRVPNIYRNETVEWLLDDDNTDEETLQDENSDGASEDSF